MVKNLFIERIDDLHDYNVICDGYSIRETHIIVYEPNLVRDGGDFTMDTLIIPLHTINAINVNDDVEQHE